MPRRPKITPHALAVVQRLKPMLRDADRRDDLSLVHRIPVISPLGGASTVFTVDVTPGQNGRYLATCREIPGFYVSGKSEGEALMKAEREIRRQLWGRK
jgi:hypothetical protein